MSAADQLGTLALRAAAVPARASLLALRAISSQLLTATDGRDVLLNSPDGWEVEQPWLWFTDGANGRVWGNPIPGADGGYTFGGIPAVARCTSIIVDTLAALPWHVYKGGERQVTPDWIGDPQALRIDGRVISSTVIDETRWSAIDVRSQWILSSLWFGDGFLYVPSRDSSGAPSPPMFVLPPDQISLDGGRFWFGSAGGEQEYERDGSPSIGRPFRPGEIIHLRGLEPIRYGRGSGVLARFASELGYGVDLRNYATSTFSSGVPAGVLKSTQPHLDDEGAADLKRAWMAAHGGKARGIAVLNATTEFQPLAFTPVDAELIGAGQEYDRHVAMAFGVPAYMLGVPGDSSTYANVESRMIELVRFTLLPWAARIEAVLSAQLPRGTEVKIELDGLMRADTATRFAAYATAIAAGFMTVDEARALEDEPPLPESVAIPTEPAAVGAP